MMKRVLAIADEVEKTLYSDRLKELKPDITVACGDLPFDYLEYIVTISGVPLLYVPGNHDPDLRKRRPEEEAAQFIQPFTFGRFDGELPGPSGCVNVDGRVTEAAGLSIAGLGGSLLYNQGPNQFTEAQMRRRALALELRAKSHRFHSGRPVDIVLTHAPPRRVGDREDQAHQGFSSFHRLIQVLRPAFLIHGHIHGYGEELPDRLLGETRIVNAVGSRLLETRT